MMTNVSYHSLWLATWSMKKYYTSSSFSMDRVSDNFRITLFIGNIREQVHEILKCETNFEY